MRVEIPLLHIGYHKTATTWLQKSFFNSQEYGFESPFIFREIIEEIVMPHDFDFYSKGAKDFFVTKINSTCDRGFMPVISAERLSGHPFSGGFDSKIIADRLKETFPNAKVLIVIREQASAILSCYNQYVKGGGVDTLSNYFLASEQYFSKRIPLFNLDHLKYDRLISYYIKLFGSDNVLVLPYEYFVQSPVEFLNRILVFSNIDKVIDNISISNKINTSLPIVEILLYRKINLIFGSRNPINRNSLIPLKRERVEKIMTFLSYVNNICPNKFNETLHNKYMSLIKRSIGNTYFESNNKTSVLIQMNLEQFNYNTT